MVKSQSGDADTLDVKKLDFGNTYYVGIELDQALAHPGSDDDIVLREGDRIIVPQYNGTVKISGDVMYPNSVGYLKGKSALVMFDHHPEWRKVTGRDRTLWARGYYVSTVGINESVIRKCVRNQEDASRIAG